MTTPKRSIIYQTFEGREPFTQYVDSLKDRRAIDKIRKRVRQATYGNLGDHRSVHRGVIELRINFGPGYRVYMGLYGQEVIVLLCAGDKSTQHKDIQKAHDYWDDYRGNL